MRYLLLILCFVTIGCGTRPEPTEQPNPVVDAGPTDPGVDPDEIPRCIPNNDGVINIDEVAFVVGASVANRRNKPGQVVKVDHVGKTDENGIVVWDFRQVEATTRVQVTTADPTGRWFLSTFPEATILTPVAFAGVTGTVYQVLRVTKDALLLEGIASEKETPDKEKILLPYEAPVPLLRFPLRLGKEWIVTGNAKGTISGLPVTSSDQYHVKVSGRGSVKLPDIQFDNSLRIEIIVRQTLIGGQKRELRQILFFHECFGEIARVESKENEFSANFTDAALVRFISF